MEGHLGSQGVRAVGRTIRFGPSNAAADARDYTLDLEGLELRHRDRRVELRPRALEALAVLLRHQGRQVPTEELRRALWGDRHLEWRNGLHRCIRDLRCALSDDARRPRFVATVARIGYRFVGVQELVGEGAPVCGDPIPARPRWRRLSVAFAAGVLTVLMLPASLFVLCAIAAR